MAKDYAKSFYTSKAWELCRLAYLNSVDGLCERCSTDENPTPGKIVHHIKYITPGNINDPYITLSWDNLEYLCQDCHNHEHHGRAEAVEPGLTFDCNGDLIQK